jgi:hypothetical protein
LDISRIVRFRISPLIFLSHNSASSLTLCADAYFFLGYRLIAIHLLKTYIFSSFFKWSLPFTEFSMELQRLHRRIVQPQDELLRMKKPRDWYHHRYQWSVSYFLNHDTPCYGDPKRTVRPMTPIALQPQRMKRNHQSNLFLIIINRK